MALHLEALHEIASPPPPAMPDRDPRPILLVEDDAEVRAILVECLEENGYAAIEAASAEIAIELLGRGLSPSLILTDINLGDGASGLVLADEVHFLQPGVPVVFITGRLDMLRNRSLRPGEFVLPKPFPLPALKGMVRRFTAPVPAFA